MKRGCFHFMPEQSDSLLAHHVAGGPQDGAPSAPLMTTGPLETAEERKAGANHFMQGSQGFVIRTSGAFHGSGNVQVKMREEKIFGLVKLRRNGETSGARWAYFFLFFEVLQIFLFTSPQLLLSRR